jgi:hypothetical protein
MMTPAEAAEETKRCADYAYTMIEDLTAAIGDVRMRMLSDAVTEALSAQEREAAARIFEALHAITHRDHDVYIAPAAASQGATA